MIAGRWKTLVRVAGIIICSGLVFTRLPRSVHTVAALTPLLTLNFGVLLLLLATHLYRTYKSAVQVSLFHACRSLILWLWLVQPLFVSLLHRVGIFWADPINRRHIRVLVQCTLIGNCLMPQSLSEFVNVESIQSFVAYKFLLDFVQFLRHGDDVTGDAAARPGGPLQPAPARRARCSRPVAVGLHVCKGAVSLGIMARQLYLSLWYFVTTFAYFLAAHRILDRPSTRALEAAQLDGLEGLEQYCTAGFFRLAEVLLAFVFMLWSLMQHQQFIMLVALYANVYTGGRDLVRSVVTTAFTEWTMLARFRRATYEELASLDDVCAICLSPMRSARRTPCAHYFHGHCLRRSLRERASCPMCSAEFSFFRDIGN